MNAYEKFLSLPPGERALLLRAGLVVSAVRLGLWLRPWGDVCRLLARALPGPAGSPRLPAERVAWAVAVAGRCVPGGGNCLVQALAGQALLRSTGHDAQVRIGVARPGADRLEAHAWVESGAAVVLGGGSRACYAPLPAWGEAGP